MYLTLNVNFFNHVEYIATKFDGTIGEHFQHLGILMSLILKTNNFFHIVDLPILLDWKIVECLQHFWNFALFNSHSESPYSSWCYTY